jgi:hypothetical protein
MFGLAGHNNVARYVQLVLCRRRFRCPRRERQIAAQLESNRYDRIWEIGYSSLHHLGGLLSHHRLEKALPDVG